MKLSDYIIFYFCIAACLIGVLFYNITLQDKASTLNTEYADKLAAACTDAAATIDMSEIENEGAAWHKDTKKNETLDVFYTTLGYGFNKKYLKENDDLEIFTPVVCMIDMDGFYISHDYIFDKESGVKMADEHGNELSDAEKYKSNAPISGLTSLNTWSKVFRKNTREYLVRFYLNDYVEVTIMSDILDTSGKSLQGKTIYGEREDVYTEIDNIYKRLTTAESSSLEALAFLKHENDNKNGAAERKWTAYQLDCPGNIAFDIVKNDVIIRSLNHQIEYYINKHNLSADDYNQKYTFTMPEISGEDWSRLLQNPTVISFLQGRHTMQEDNNFLNIYSLAGGEIMEKYHYFIDDTGVYHCLEGVCLDSSGNNRITKVEKEEIKKYKNYAAAADATITDKEKKIKVTEYYFDGELITKTYPSMEMCAQKGAQACKCAYDLNGLK